MLRGLSKKVKTIINQFPVRKGGVSDTISPEEIVEGKQKIDLSKKRVNFGQYVEIHDGTTNTSSERAVGAIAMYHNKRQRRICIYVCRHRQIQAFK